METKHRENRQQMRDRKRREAEARNALTPHENTRAHRLGRCNCPEVTA